MQARLRFFFMQSMATLRTSELFDMIIDYPDSLPALSDLKETLQHTHTHAQLSASLAEAIDTRLLKPGTDTSKSEIPHIQPDPARPRQIPPDPAHPTRSR